MDEVGRRKLEEISCGEVMLDCPLARFTTYAIGGPADALIVIDKKEQLAPLLAFIDEQSLSWRIIGKGSNILVSDSGYKGVVIVLGKSLSQIDGEQIRGEKALSLTVGAGCSLTKLNHHCCSKGIGGMEFSYGIPGTLGGAVVMNAGAWGKDMSEVVTEVGVITKGGYQTLTGEQLDFTYRRWPGFTSYLGKGVVVDVTLALEKKEKNEVTKRAKELLEKRKAIQPHNYPNGGSVFKNPPGDSAGRMIDACGMKGRSIGGAMISEKHANFIVNKDKATAAEVLALIQEIQHAVKKSFAVDLLPELHML